MLTLPSAITHEHAAAQLKVLAEGLHGAGAESVVLDCAALAQFDSSALALLLGLNRAAQAAGKALRLRACPPRLRQLAAVYGVLELFELEGADTRTP